MSALIDFVGPLAALVAWSYLPMPSVGNWALKVCQYYTHFNCQAHESAQPSLFPATKSSLPWRTIADEAGDLHHFIMEKNLDAPSW